MRWDLTSAVRTINIIQSAGALPLSDVRAGKKKTVIGAGQSVQVRCHAPVGLLEVATPVLFQPDELQGWPEALIINDKLLMLQKGICRKVPVTVVNTSKHEVTLYPDTLLGRLELVNSVTPVEVALGKKQPILSGGKVEGECQSEEVGPSVSEPVVVNEVSADHDSVPFDPDVTYSPLLTDEQKEKVKALLREECESFMRNSDDINVIDDLEMKLHMHDETPVQKQYRRIPKPLYPEVKNYLEDLLNRQ